MTRTFRLWAPLPKKVELQIGSSRFPMGAAPVGCLEATVSADGDYGFIVDGEGPFPDPRSPWQPQGIFGLSRSVNHSEFHWTDEGWQAPPLSSAVIYELHVGTFTPQGTFDAVIEKLDYLAQLGVTHVEIMPVNEFSGARGWGYDGVDLFAPHHAYGGPAGLKRLVDACHACRLAVLLDVVYNHLGPAGNYLGKYAPYFTKHYSSPWGTAVNFDDADSGEVRRFFCDNALMWLRDYHIDGLRLDAVHAIFDASAIPFLEQLVTEVRQLEAQLKRPLVLIAESDLNDPRLLHSQEEGGFGLHAQWSDDFHNSLHVMLTGEKSGYYVDFGGMGDFCKALCRAWVYDGRYSVYRRRPHGRPPTGLKGNRFLAYIQNHDQVGNRAQGDRIGRIISPGRLKIAAALVLTSPFVPMLFQGEEWNASSPFIYFTDHQDPGLAKAVREGRRNEFKAFGWNPEEIPDPQGAETFLRSKLDWSELSRPERAEYLDWHRKLIALRRAEPALRDGDMDALKTRQDVQAQWLVVERGPFAVACNLAPAAQPVPLRVSEKREVVLSSGPIGWNNSGNAVLPPDSVAVLKLTN